MPREDWRHKLDKDDLIHLMEIGVHDFAGLKRNMDAQAADRKRSPRIEPCWTCKSIAINLGMKI